MEISSTSVFLPLIDASVVASEIVTKLSELTGSRGGVASLELLVGTHWNARNDNQRQGVQTAN